MIDVITHKPIEVSTDGGAGPYLIVPFEQLNKITALLDSDRVSYSVDEEVLSVGDEPEVAFINLDEETDAMRVQRLLDSVP